ncbi:MAG: HAD-IA family hydrolase, partial [Oscillospiraceae bacterium]|nr:HAD-IA family hydrolase [Oscillospiraceae bacterium]
DVKIEKPNPEGLLWAIEHLDAMNEEILYVGDSLVDAKTAENAKVEFVDRLKINSYHVMFNLTIYNDEEHKEFDDESMPLKRERGKWVIDISKF